MIADDGKGGRTSRPLTVIGHPPVDTGAPAFATGAAIPEVRLQAGVPMGSPVELPAAGGGDLPPGGVFGLAYRVSTLPAGLRFDPATRRLTGTPAAGTAGAYPVAYRADDRDAVRERSDAAILTFVIRVADGVCDRPAAVRAALVAAVGAGACGAVSDAHLAGITALDLSGLGLERLRADDLVGLSGLRRLDLSGNPGLELDGELFRFTPALQVLRLDRAALGALPANFATYLGGLEELSLNDNRLRLAAGTFAGLGRLQRLALRDNGLAALPDNVFSGLVSLRQPGPERQRAGRRSPGAAFESTAGEPQPGESAAGAGAARQPHRAAVGGRPPAPTSSPCASLTWPATSWRAWSPALSSDIDHPDFPRPA